ncbi:MAG: protein DpdE [Planctomycetaceae bacterium]|jgi:ATP-dependent helicase HepA
MQKKVRRTMCPGQFVSSTANLFGTGRFIEVIGEEVIIEYFESPAIETPSVQSVPLSTVRPVRLEQEHRVYLKVPETLEWQIGRVLDYQAGDHRYLVQFPNDDRRLIPESELRTRWLQPIADPTDQLAFGLNETAFWHAGRAGFVRSIFSQRRACGGMTAILSSAIDIEKHQVAVVRRVLQDSVQRYLLADEVGLGKTIEAGVLIRQHVLDDPTGHRVLIILPTSLLRQWREELRSRFFLEDQLDRSIHLVALGDRERIEAFGQDARMIVIDEAHHLAAYAWSRVAAEVALFDLVAKITEPLDRKLLLLSATPALHNERGFLAMLHLLDPAMYSLDNPELFQERVRERQRVAEVLSALQFDEPNRFMKQAVESIGEMAPTDQHLTGLARELADYLEGDPGEQDPLRTQLITQLRSHISETWRLHRRILRTRRSKDSQVLLPGRDGAYSRFWNCPGQDAVDEAFNEWRVTIAQGVSPASLPDNRDQLVRVMAEAIVSDPSLVPLLVSARLGQVVDLAGLALFPDQMQALLGVPIVDGEPKQLSRLSHLAAKLDLQAFNDLLISVVEAELNSPIGNKISIVLFANYPATADGLYKILQRRFGQHRIFRHSDTSSAWLQALSETESHVLVCDRRAEEGLNLQGRRTVIVHADLPLSPNRVEQRVGRVDRFGSGQRIRSLVLINEHSELQNLWFQTLSVALKVFDRSVASLQYVIEAEFSRAWSNFMECGCEAIQDMLERLSGPTGLIEREFKHVRSQSDLDSFEYDSERDALFVKELLAVDIKSSDLRGATDGWIKSRLQFEWRGENGPKDSVFRYQFCRRNNNRARSRMKDTLMSLGDLQHSLLHSFEIADDAGDEVLFESMPLTFDRQIAQRRFARLARVGDPLIDTFTEFLKTDDRGVAFAIWRYRPDIADLDTPAELMFRFDFAVEANADPALRVLEAHHAGTHTAIRRTLDDCFPPLATTIWLDSNLQLVQDAKRIAIVSRAYNADWNLVNTARVRDFNLNQEIWSVVRKWWDTDYWMSLCRRARMVAEEALRAAHEMQSVCDKSARICREQASVRCQSLESRRTLSSGQTALQLDREIEFERTLAVALQSGIQNPVLRLDSLGAVFLSNQNPFASLPKLDSQRNRSRIDE